VELKLPSEYAISKKDVCTRIRELFDIPDNEPIVEHFNYFTSMARIEEELFGSLIGKEEEYKFFPLRLYVTHNTKDNLKKKVQGYFAKLTQDVGTAHLAVQVADNVLHWFNSGFVFIKEWRGSKATALFYPQNNEGVEIPLIDNTAENRARICKVIQEWNCLKEYNSRVNNCQKFASQLFESVDLNGTFSKYEGWVGEFIRFVANTGNEVNPCLVRDGGVLIEWRSHEDLDKWHNQNKTTFPEASGLLKAMHRAFQLRGDPGIYCPHDAPTLLVTNTGKKIPILGEFSFSSAIDSYVPLNSGPSNGFSSSENKK